MMVASRVLITIIVSVAVALASPPYSAIHEKRIEEAGLMSTTSATSLVDPKNVKECDAKQLAVIQKAVDDAKQMAVDAWDNYFKKLGSTPAHGADLRRYTAWFGAYTLERYKKVYDRFNAFRNFYDLNVWDYHCNPLDRCGLLEQFYIYAQCVPSDIKRFAKMDLCRKFFWTTDKERASTLIHEASHFTHEFRAGVALENVLLSVKGTNSADAYKTEVYGSGKCAELAIKDPEYAVENADNYSFFVEYPEGCPPVKGCVLA